VTHAENQELEQRYSINMINVTLPGTSIRSGFIRNTPALTVELSVRCRDLAPQTET